MLVRYPYPILEAKAGELLARVGRAEEIIATIAFNRASLAATFTGSAGSTAEVELHKIETSNREVSAAAGNAAKKLIEASMAMRAAEARVGSMFGS